MKGGSVSRSASELRTTAVTLAEIGYGIARLPEGHRKALLKMAAEAVFAAFPEQSSPSTMRLLGSTARLSIAVTALARRSTVSTPRSLPSAEPHKAALVTRDLKDFADTGIVLIDPRQSHP